MRKLLSFTCGILLILVTAVVANAELLTIGTATYNGSDYNLIWNDDNNGNSLIWLDYTNVRANWADQNAWAAELSLTYHIDAAYTVDWIDSAWRLPSATADPNAGYERTSEMGNLYYVELGLLGIRIDDHDNNGVPYYDGTDLNNSLFDNLSTDGYYWSSTEVADIPQDAWALWMGNGLQAGPTKSSSYIGLAVRSGQVQENTTSSVPEPATLLLLGFGLIGLAGLRKKA